MADITAGRMTLLELNRTIRQTLEKGMADTYLVTAEVQSITCARTGHAYLDLIEKAENSQQIVSHARATIWAGQYRMIKPYFETTTGCTLQAGINILVKCKVSFHEIYGLSLNITDIIPEYTLGEMAMARQRTINQLKQEGVFDMNRQCQLPRLIKRIAVISSAGAAGYGDFVNQLKNNSFGYTFMTELFESAMQGNTAEDSIIYQLENIAGRADEFDCVVIIRGGGSKTDLQCFDGYRLCQNICQVPLPVITGIGHDRDESVADLVAHTHLKTPTAVAQFIIDRAMECETMLNQKVSAIFNKLRNICPQKLRTVETKHNTINTKMKLLLQQKASKVDIKLSRIFNILNTKIMQCDSQLKTKELLIEAQNPMNILKKGYTYTKVNGKATASASKLKPGDVITTVFHDGEVISVVNG